MSRGKLQRGCHTTWFRTHRWEVTNLPSKTRQGVTQMEVQSEWINGTMTSARSGVPTPRGYPARGRNGMSVSPLAPGVAVSLGGGPRDGCGPGGTEKKTYLISGDGSSLRSDGKTDPERL